MKRESKNEFLRICSAFVNSWNGLKVVFKNESAFRSELILLVLSLFFSWFFFDKAWERLLLVCSVIFVMIVELLNSAVEATVDRISKDYHDLSKIAKDIGSASVLLSLVLLVIVWCFLFFFR